MTLELSRPMLVDRVPSDGYAITVTATKAECAALAVRMGLPAIRSVTCAFRLKRETDTKVFAEGRLRARVTQTCVVSMEDFPAVVLDEFRVRFVPAGEESDDEDPESDDEIGYEGNAIDLGEATAEQLGLALEPYPRKPDAALPEADAAPDAPAEPDAKPNPFAVLAALRKPR